ncbi:MAG: hypothetical protein HKN68_17480 [Saprospiraceae bacterium]|nr:hypothetical protein [Saprospiraceae bacterium]
MVCNVIDISAQSENLPYYSIPDAPDTYDAHNVAARMVDGLGYRYFWATEGLRDEDLSYRPSETSRTTMETIEHIFGLSKTIINASLSKPNISGGSRDEMTFKEYREATLKNLIEASNNLRNHVVPDMEEMKVIFQRGENSRELPFWNMINGPIADAIWHSGQVVAFRRASGNPLHPGVSVLNGKTRVE